MHNSCVSSEKEDAIALATAEILLSTERFDNIDSAVTNIADAAESAMITVSGNVFSAEIALITASYESIANTAART